MCDGASSSSDPNVSSIQQNLDEEKDEIRHELSDQWKLWFMKFDGRKSWKENLKLMATVDTVELFFQIHNHILQPSKMTGDSTYFFFKNNIQPEWENLANRNGGKWEFRTRDETVIDQMWLDAQLLLIGGEDANNRSLNGCVIQRKRREFRISLWISDSRNEKLVAEIGESFKRAIKTPSADFTKHTGSS